MEQSIVKLLKCPICHSNMTVTDDGKSCKCKGIKTHCYDFAKSGHLYLGGPHLGEGDGKAAVLSRRAFLDAGYYQCLSDRINEILDGLSVKNALDAGCGEGYYTNRMAQNRPALGVDLSRFGVEYAAKRAKSIGSHASFVVASLFQLPVQDASLDAVINIFAPCAEEEFLRVLKPGGVLLMVGAGEEHLMGLKSILYDNPYQNQSRADLPTHMQLMSKERLRAEITVKGQEQIEALFSMTPYYWRTSPTDHDKLSRLEHLTTVIDFDIFLFRKVV